MQKLFVLFFALIITCSNLFSQQEIRNDDIKNDHTKTEFNILFIGNSLTYTNNLPQLVKKNARLKGIEINTKIIAFPNYAIMDHWKDGQVQKLIASKKYDFVIVQQGPSSQKFGNQILIEYGDKLNEVCKSNGAKLSYFMVWPSLDYYQNFENVINNYRNAATKNGSILLPVGEVWKEHFDATNTFDYYGPDGFHPSLKGSQVAAKVIVESLFNK